MFNRKGKETKIKEALDSLKPLKAGQCLIVSCSVRSVSPERLKPLKAGQCLIVSWKQCCFLFSG